MQNNHPTIIPSPAIQEGCEDGCHFCDGPETD